MSANKGDEATETNATVRSGERATGPKADKQNNTADVTISGEVNAASHSNAVVGRPVNDDQGARKANNAAKTNRSTSNPISNSINNTNTSNKNEKSGANTGTNNNSIAENNATTAGQRNKTSATGKPIAANNNSRRKAVAGTTGNEVATASADRGNGDMQTAANTAATRTHNKADRGTRSGRNEMAGNTGNTTHNTALPAAGSLTGAIAKTEERAGKVTSPEEKHEQKPVLNSSAPSVAGNAKTADKSNTSITARIPVTENGNDDVAKAGNAAIAPAKTMPATLAAIHEADGSPRGLALRPDAWQHRHQQCRLQDALRR